MPKEAAEKTSKKKRTRKKRTRGPVIFAHTTTEYKALLKREAECRGTSQSEFVHYCIDYTVGQTEPMPLRPGAGVSREEWDDISERMEALCIELGTLSREFTEARRELRGSSPAEVLQMVRDVARRAQAAMDAVQALLGPGGMRP